MTRLSARFLVAAVSCVCSVVAAAAPAWAVTSPPSPTGSLNGGTGGVAAGGTAPGDTGQPVSIGNAPPPPSDNSGFVWRQVGPNQNAVCFDNGTTAPWGGFGTPPPQPPAGAALIGPDPRPMQYQLFDPAGNPVGPVKDVCPATGAAAPPPPPPPPSPAEVVAHTPFPAETIHHDPCYMGLTGLQSGLWATVNNAPVPPIAATVNIRGYSVVVTAHPVKYRWDMGDGDLVVGLSPGNEQAPSVSYMYQTKGKYTLSLTVTWAGTYSFSGYGQASTTALAEVAQAPQRLLWPVEEVRSVLVAPGSSNTGTTLPSGPSAC
jgi:hypothetical protein